MGVDTTFYTVYGLKLPYSSEFSEAYHTGDTDLALEECTIMDGMGGEYIVVGDILFSAGLHEDSEFVEIENGSVDARKADIIAKYEHHMPAHADALKAGTWRLMSFVHYS